MKKALLKTLLTAGCLIPALSTLAEETQGVFLSAGYNQIKYDSERPLENSGDFYLGFGYQINNHWSFDLQYSQFEAPSFAVIDFEHDLWSLAANYRYQARGENSLFWRLGVGDYQSQPVIADSSTINFGVGYDMPVNDNFSWQIGTDLVFADEGAFKDYRPYFGLQYFFGNKAKTAPTPPPAPATPQPKDDDRDGVINSIDQCPDSASGVKVDSKGCELDSDKDGVTDSKDQCAATPQGAKVDSTGCRLMLSKDVSITLKVNFANNSDVVSDSYKDEIGRVAKFMQEYPDTTVVIEGHTDSRGAASYNQQLSQKRAAAVSAYLVKEFNIAPSRVSSVGKGEVEPIADNETAEGRATNRRVQAEIKTTIKTQE